MRPHRLVVLATLLALAAGCSAGGTDTASPGVEMAAEVDRVAGLLDDGHTCEALEATRTIEVMADRDDVSIELREAVHAYIRQARTELTCDRASSPTPTTPTEPQDDGNEGDGEGRDEDDDEDDDDRPGRGRGRDNGNGNGNGNDD